MLRNTLCSSYQHAKWQGQLSRGIFAIVSVVVSSERWDDDFAALSPDVQLRVSSKYGSQQAFLETHTSVRRASIYDEDPFFMGKERLYAFLTQFFPHKQQKDVQPFLEWRSGRHVCHTRLKCNYRRLGIGRRGIASYWAFAFAAPLGTALLIICFTSMRPRSDGKLKMQTGRTFAAMLISTLAAFVAGLCTYNVSDQDLLSLCLIPISFAVFSFFVVATFWSVDVEFGRLELSASPYLQVVSCLYTLFLMAGYAALIFLRPFSYTYSWTFRLFVDVQQAYDVFCAALVPRNMAFFLWLLLTTRRYIVGFFFWDDTTGEAMFEGYSVGFPMYFLNQVFILLCWATPYSRDRYFVAAFGCLALITLKMGTGAHSLPLVSMEMSKHIIRFDLAHIVEVIVISMMCCIAMRFQIVLPEQLQKVRFLRLGYLYELRRGGLTIKRCQELPESAFGNPAKVARMVIISHHWLDGHTCDVKTLECPQGLRLTTMCQRLERFFPSTWPSFRMVFANPLSSWRSALWSATYSNYDVLVFFDFTCLPQIGTLPDGTLIERTPEEQEIFKFVLPACGLLYTMFPVLVCPEVTEGLTPYMSSGWCFCEWEQAQLCGTLSPYSVDQAQAMASTPTVTTTRGGADGETGGTGGGFSRQGDLQSAIEEELKGKQFRCEEDRDIVRHIVKGTWIRRALHAAAVEQDPAKVAALLQKLTDYNLQETVSFPVDSETLDSLLHVAMKLPSEEVQALLIDYGADTARPNHRGEEPGNFLLFRRSWFPCLR